jgi:hypothetical protein
MGLETGSGRISIGNGLAKCKNRHFIHRKPAQFRASLTQNAQLPWKRDGPRIGARPGGGKRLVHCTAFTMSKIGRYMATTMPPTTTPSTTIMIGSMSESSVPTAASTSSS